MLPCWQLQELAEGVGDINTEAKLLLLIITSVCVKEALSGQKEQKEPGSQRQETRGPRRRLAGPRGRGGFAGAVPAAASAAAGDTRGGWDQRGFAPGRGCGDTSAAGKNRSLMKRGHSCFQILNSTQNIKYFPLQ